LAAMDVFAFTSIEKDTSPLALLSAMAVGLPIVAFDIEGVRELDNTGRVFALARVGDIDALAESLSSVLSDTLTREELRQHSRAAAEKLSLSRYVSSIDHVLTTTCNRANDSSTVGRTRDTLTAQDARAVSATANSLN